MKQRVFDLPDDLDTRLQDEAARRQVTVSALAREAIEQYLHPIRRRKFAAAGAGHGGQGDIGERMEESLREEMEPG